jgi:hypothetical protein
MPDSLQVELKNDSDSSNLHAYIVSLAHQLTLNHHTHLLTNNRQASHSNTPPNAASSNPTARIYTSPPK